MAKKTRATIKTQDKSFFAKAKYSAISVYRAAMFCKLLHEIMPTVIDAIQKLIT